MHAKLVVVKAGCSAAFLTLGVIAAISFIVFLLALPGMADDAPASFSRPHQRPSKIAAD